MRTGEELAIAAMKKDHAKLVRAAEKAKAAADEYITIGTEAIAIHNEFAAIVNNRETGADTIKKLDQLKKRRDRVDRISKKDFMALCDKQYEAEVERDNLGREIQNREFLASMRSKNAR